jgi:hypothetical protein
LANDCSVMRRLLVLHNWNRTLNVGDALGLNLGQRVDSPLTTR